MIYYTNYNNSFEMTKNFELKVNQISNPETLNIFTDSGSNKFGRAYGAIFVNNNAIINEDVRRITPELSNNLLELYGLKLGIGYIVQYLNQFPFINVFSDSAYAIKLLRSGVFYWFWSYRTEKFFDKNGKVPPNQDTVVEITNMLLTLTLCYGVKINLFYCPAHIKLTNQGLIDARETFKRVNDIPNKVDVNFVRYICTYNDIIDRKVGKLTRLYDDRYYEEALSYISSPVQIKF